MLYRVGRGWGLGSSLGVGVALGVAVAVGVAVTVGVAVAVGWQGGLSHRCRVKVLPFCVHHAKVA